MDFSIADSTCKTNEDVLLKDAGLTFMARAQLAADALGGQGYKIVNLTFNTSGYPESSVRGGMLAAATRSTATPEVEAGTSDASMIADGVIEDLS